jgi:regulator of protease activity HflC (stomatin/prohibitin superfamily)
MMPISDMLHAPKHFGMKTYDGATPVVLTPTRGACSFIMEIPHGCAAIVTSYGKSLGVYKSGWYCLPPWYKVAYLVNTQHIPYHFQVKECPTRDNVQIKIDVDVMLHIKDPVSFVFDIGPEKLEELLRATQAEAVRSLVRSIKVQEAYNLRGAEGADMVNSLNDKLNHYGVQIEFVTIANVTLPPSIAVAMQTETTFESKQTEQRKRQEFDMKVLNDNNYTERVKQDRENERRKANEEAKKQRNLITQEISTLEANMQKLLMEIEAARNADVLKIIADGRFEVAKLTAEKDRIILETKAKGQSEVQKNLAETDKVCRMLRSNATVNVAENDAKALETLGEAEQKAADKFKAKRKFELELQQIQLWEELSKNSHLLISGDGENANNSLVNQLFALQKLTGIVNSASSK